MLQVLLLFIATILPAAQIQDVIGLVSQRQEVVQEINIIDKFVTQSSTDQAVLVCFVGMDQTAK